MTLFFSLGFLAMYVTSIGAVTNFLMNRLELFTVADPQQLDAQAIVVLGAELYRDAPEYGQDTLASLILERVRYAAWLQKRCGLPILVSGGAAEAHTLPQAKAMKMALRDEFGVDVKWLEDKSRNTFENGRNSASILEKEGIHRIALVTHAYHMPRSVKAFEWQGLTVMPAPTVFYGRSESNMKLSDWIPSSTALYRNRLALHELFGLWFYRFRYFNY